jgi:hypothetical protein
MAICICSLALALLGTGLLPVTQTGPAVRFFLTFVLVFGPLQLWVAWRTMARKPVALWVGLILPVAQLAYQLGSATGYIPEGGVMTYSMDLGVWQSQVANLGFLNLFQITLFSIALVAYHANRHVPGFVPAGRLPSK